MIALPATIMVLLRDIPMSAWTSLEQILIHIVRGGDPNDARIRSEALAAHLALRAPLPSVPAALALSQLPKAH